MQPEDRLHALDAVRSSALLLGVVLHSCAAFLQDFPIPMWRDQPHAAPAVMYFVIHMFRMSAFYLMAGFFGRMLLERRGVRAFVKDRLKRIALPLFLFGPVIFALIGVGFVLGALAHGTHFLTLLLAQQQNAQPPGATRGANIDLAHLWFLYYLLIFYALALPIRALVHAIGARQSVAGVCDRAVAWVIRGWWTPVVLGLPIALYLFLHRTWTEWLGLPAPGSLVPDTTALIGYGIPFALGWLLQRQPPLLLQAHKQWGTYLVAAGALTVLCLSIIGLTPHWTGPTLFGRDRLLYAMAYSIGIWCWVFGFVGAAQRFLSHGSVATRYLADASYWIYLMHMSSIVFFLTLMRPYHWHWSIKLIVMVGGSMPILLVSYHFLVRFTWIGAILNGRRRPRPLRAPVAPAPSASG